MVFFDSARLVQVLWLPYAFNHKEYGFNYDSYQIFSMLHTGHYIYGFLSPFNNYHHGY